jgi:signal transduction histidine kinase
MQKSTTERLQASGASDATEELLALVAHELRQPIAAILFAVHVIEQHDEPARVERARRTLERQVTQVMRLLDDLLEFIQGRRSRLDLRRVRLDLREAVEAAVDAIRPSADTNGQRLAVVIPAFPLWVDADPQRIQQILLNLLSNALKHTPRGKHIWVQAEQSGTRVVLTVTDDGDGIRASELHRIFEMFHQGAGDCPEGFGIGLCVVKQLAELQGGTVQAFSQGPGRGTRFVVELPSPAPARLLAAGV